VHIIKKVAIGLAVALTMASFAAASASASQRSFAAGQYPATFVSEGLMELTTANGATKCGASLSGELTSATPTPKASIYAECANAFIASNLSTNGCRFELNSDYNTLSIGPAGCGQMSVKMGTTGSCTTYYPPQNGIPATFEKITVGGQPAVRLAVATNSLKYHSCSAEGELREDGSINATWDLVGRTAEGAVTSLTLTTPSYTNALSAEKYPATLSGTSSEVKFTFDGNTVTCTKTTYKGTLSSVWERTDLIPSFSGCTMFGLKNSLVSGGGCTIGTSLVTGYQAIECPEGHEIKMAQPSPNVCEVFINSQNENITGATSENTTGANGRSAVRVKDNMAGLTFTAYDGSFFCPLNGSGTRSNGTFSDNVVVEGQDSAGPIAIKKGA
jgi:hypothetical protein